MFTSRLQDPHEETDDPTLADVERYLARLSFDPNYFLDIDGDTSMDGGITLHGSSDGIALIGSEDSMHASFAFHFVDPCRNPGPRTVTVHEISNTNVCDSVDDIASIARTYALNGDLDRNFHWSLNISVGDLMHYHCKLDRGDTRPLSEILAIGPGLPRWPRDVG